LVLASTENAKNDPGHSNDSVSEKLDILINLMKNNSSKENENKLDKIINLLSDKSNSLNKTQVNKINAQTSSHNDVNKLRLCNNLVDLQNLTSDLIIEENEDCYVIYCQVCNNFVNVPQHDRPTDFVVPKGGPQGCLSRGLKISKSKFEQLKNGKCQEWHNFKFNCKAHFFENTSSSCHQVAVRYFEKSPIASPTVLVNHIKAAVTLIKSKAANRCFEEQLCTLKVCGAAVGDFGFSRKNLNDIMQCLNVVLNDKFETFVKTNLKSTLMKPHLFLTADKSTKHRQTTQIIMLSCVVDGVRQAFPIDLIPVYDNCDGTGATMPDLATRSIESIKAILNLSEEDLQYIQGKAADGQYVRSEFNNTLLTELKAVNNFTESEMEYFMPIIWDSAHWIDLVFNKLREHPETKSFLCNFINKVSSINKMFHAGKLFTLSELTAVDLKMEFKRVSNVASHRFLSSNFKLMKNLFNSLPVLIETFRDHKNTDDGEYLLAGQDFIIDLMALIDIIEPLSILMLRAQKLNRPGWLIINDCEKVLAVWESMENELLNQKFEKMSLMKENFNHVLDKKLKSVTILEGWTCTGEEVTYVNNKRRKVCNWEQREVSDCVKDLLNVVRLFKQFLKSSMNEKVPKLYHDLISVFDFEKILPSLAQSNECTAFLSMFKKTSALAQKLSHFSIFSADDFENAPQKLKEFSRDLFFGDLKHYLCKVFEFSNDLDKSKSIQLIETSSECDSSLSCNIIFTMATGEQVNGLFNLDKFIKLLYCDPKIFNRVGNLFVALFDLYFSKAGNEIVCETFFKYVENHLMEGNQNNATLFLRSKIDYCSPNVTQCNKIFLEAANLFVTGSSKHNLSKHLHPINPYFKNKVYERLQHEPVKFSFLLDKNK